MQCPGSVCAALAASSGGSGWYLVLCLPPFPLPAPRVPRCVSRAVPSGCALSSLAGTPFHAVPRVPRAQSGCFSGSPHVPSGCVCARAAAASASPPPPLGCVACARPAVSALGAGRAVPRGPCPFACPAPVPCSVWRAWGGAAWSRCPPTWLGVVRPRPVWVCASGAFLCRGVGWGWGGGCPCAAPPVCAAGGGSGAGGRSASFRPSTFPWQVTKRVSLASFWSWRAGPHTALVRARLPSLGAVRAASWRVGAGSLAPRGSCGSRRLGRGGGPCSSPSHGHRGPAGGRGYHPPCLRGGGGRHPRGLRARGGGGGVVGVAPWPPAPPLVVGAFPPACVFGRGRGAAPCTGCGLPGGGGGEEGRRVDRFPGGPFRPETSLCPP